MIVITLTLGFFLVLLALWIIAEFLRLGWWIFTRGMTIVYQGSKWLLGKL